MKKCQISDELLVCAIVGSFVTPPVIGQVPEIPRRSLGGIAQVTTTRSGQPVIYYNPRTVRRLGPELSEFFRAHEYAHLRLNHLNRPISKRQAEAEADAYAARTASPAAVAAAQRWFMRGNGGSRHHGSGSQRASRLSGTGSVSGYTRSRSNQRYAAYPGFRAYR